MEKWGLGPERLREGNPGLVYARVTGWGQTGPRARTAGHDINYVALSGALGSVGRADTPPPPPLALLGDMSGGGLLMVIGILAALQERNSSGRGQVVDIAMLDGAALLMAAFWERLAEGRWLPQREANIVDGGAPFYDTYECSDGRYVAVGAIEPKFFRDLLARLGLTEAVDHRDRSTWPHLRTLLRGIFATRARDEWAAMFADTDSCVTPVLTMWEGLADGHNQARDVVVERDGVLQPHPAPRFERTPGWRRPPTLRDTVDALQRWGLDPEEFLSSLPEHGRLERPEDEGAP
jgi:alpha-methylacyl-CoA racemase